MYFDELAAEKPADLNLHSFQNWIYPSLAGKGSFL